MPYYLITYCVTGSYSISGRDYLGFTSLIVDKDPVDWLIDFRKNLHPNNVMKYSLVSAIPMTESQYNTLKDQDQQALKTAIAKYNKEKEATLKEETPSKSPPEHQGGTGNEAKYFWSKELAKKYAKELKTSGQLVAITKRHPIDFDNCDVQWRVECFPRLANVVGYFWLKRRAEAFATREAGKDDFNYSITKQDYTAFLNGGIWCVACYFNTPKDKTKAGK
jgi:hypothetical protein